MLLETFDQLNQTQQVFVRWNAERSGISENDSFDRLRKSWDTVDGGFGGGKFREFNVTCHDVFQVLYGDNSNEVMQAYEFFAPLHLLRMLSYPEPNLTASHFLPKQLDSFDSISILDFGCGLAQQSRALARYFIAAGKQVKLHLADIPTIRKEFLLYLCAATGIEADFLDCTKQTPIPALPPHKLCIATEFFEHVYEPVNYFLAIDQKMDGGGLLVTNVANHNKEFMHVCPNLADLRQQIQQHGYQALKPDRVFRKKPDSGL